MNYKEILEIPLSHSLLPGFENSFLEHTAFLTSHQMTVELSFMIIGSNLYTKLGEGGKSLGGKFPRKFEH